MSVFIYKIAVILYLLKIPAYVQPAVDLFVPSSSYLLVVEVERSRRLFVVVFTMVLKTRLKSNFNFNPSLKFTSISLQSNDKIKSAKERCCCITIRKKIQIWNSSTWEEEVMMGSIISLTLPHCYACSNLGHSFESAAAAAISAICKVSIEAMLDVCTCQIYTK